MQPSSAPGFEKNAFRTLLQQAAQSIGIRLTNRQNAQFAMHAERLALWNRKMNLTAIRDPVDVVLKHFIDSIAPYRHIEPGAELIDIGSGAGFPGIPLKVMRPSIDLTLMDARRKKVHFLKEVIRILALDKSRADHMRIEDWPGAQAAGRCFDVVVARALSALPRFVKLAAPLLKTDGCLMYYGDPPSDAARSIAARSNYTMIHGCRWYWEGVAYTLPVLNLKRQVVILKRQASAAAATTHI